MEARESIFAVFYHVFANAVLVTGPCQRFNPIFAPGTRIPLAINRPKVGIPQSPRGIKFRAFRPGKNHN